MILDFNDGTWVRDRSDANTMRQTCGCVWVCVYRVGWTWSSRCDEHKDGPTGPKETQ